VKRAALALLPAIVLAGCATDMDAANSPPLALVGDGVSTERAALPAAFVDPEIRAPNSLWSRNNRGVFGDLRARKVGDIVTVTIDIDDKAQFDNTSGRSKEGSAKGAFGIDLSFGGFGGPDHSGSASGNLDASGSLSAKGEGSIDRSEKLHLAIAAFVTEVLPDGKLLISGSQEVRVNHEVRVLTIAGIVRPLDISSDNMIAYDKIAEARISYGGRGKISAVQ
jgi:flagellar L-ring protein precursor FlgH